jgi:hypothetical protein
MFNSQILRRIVSTRFSDAPGPMGPQDQNSLDVAGPTRARDERDKTGVVFNYRAESRSRPPADALTALSSSGRTGCVVDNPPFNRVTCSTRLSVSNLSSFIRPASDTRKPYRNRRPGSLPTSPRMRSTKPDSNSSPTSLAGAVMLSCSSSDVQRADVNLYRREDVAELSVKRDDLAVEIGAQSD